MKLTNDKYYTPDYIAEHCWNKIIEILGIEFSDIIEPSVGNGVFMHNENLKPNICYDIAPEYSSNDNCVVLTEDYLSADIKYKKNRLIVGNPPYGDRMYLAQKFFKKSVEIADYIAFVLPISQLNNTRSLYEFDLVYSEDLGTDVYTDRKLHCCFNIYKRPITGKFNTRPVDKLKDITIIRQDSKNYADKDYDIRMCYWGDGTAGKILSDDEIYSAEYKIKINNDELKDKIINCLCNFDWKSYLKCIAMRKIQQFHIIDVLKKEIPEIK